MEKLEIPLSKTKMLLAVAGSILFVVAGLYFIFYLADRSTRYSPVIIRIAGIAAVLFFGAMCVFGMVKLFDSKDGLTIDDDGILDNSSATAIGRIKWNDIQSIKMEQVASAKFILIYVQEPQQYIDMAKGFKKKLLQANNRMYGTPVTIGCTTLNYKFEDLEIYLKKCLQEHALTRQL